jgi:beta-lactam-binding protein with PASTA domain
VPRIVIPDTPTVARPAPAAPAYMPAVVCMNLQSAQNAIQAAGVFYSRSADASGAGRMQVNDSNWVVVEQDPAPGVLIGEGDAVLSVVKTGEPNNC